MNYHGLAQLDVDLGRPSGFWPVACAVVLFIVLTAWALAMGSDRLDELHAIEAERVEAIEQAQREQRRIAAMQAMCGGENAVYTETPDGGMRCTSKRGLVTVVRGGK